MNFSFAQLFNLAWPHLVLLIGGLICMISSVVGGRKSLLMTTVIALIAFAVSGYGFYEQWHSGAERTLDFLVFDPYGNFIGMILTAIGFVTSTISYHYVQSQEESIPEFFSLLLFSVSGMTLMVATTHLLTFVLALEVMSLSLYILVGMRRYDKASSEASFKYFLLGSVATAILLFGISLFYGATGSLELRTLFTVNLPEDLQRIFQWGALLIVVGLAFKVAAVPFQFWAPDVYDGAPYPVTGFMSTGVKVAAFGALLRVVQSFGNISTLPTAQWVGYLSLVTMVVANLAALRQKALKRILAYSSISHAGYLLLGVTSVIQGNVFHPENLGPVLFYFLAYSLLTLGAFALLTALSSGGEEFTTLDHLNGLAERHPIFSAGLSLFFISLAGVPPTAGFFAKYFLFSQAIDMKLYLLAIVGILMSAVSLYYYLGPVVRMYFRKSEKSWPIPSMGIASRAMVALLVVGVFYLGLFFNRPVQMAKATKIFSPASSEVGSVDE